MEGVAIVSPPPEDLLSLITKEGPMMKTCHLFELLQEKNGNFWEILEKLLNICFWLLKPRVVKTFCLMKVPKYFHHTSTCFNYQNEIISRLLFT